MTIDSCCSDSATPTDAPHCSPLRRTPLPPSLFFSHTTRACAVSHLHRRLKAAGSADWAPARSQRRDFRHVTVCLGSFRGSGCPPLDALHPHPHTTAVAAAAAAAATAAAARTLQFSNKVLVTTSPRFSHEEFPWHPNLKKSRRSAGRRDVRRGSTTVTA